MIKISLLAVFLSSCDVATHLDLKQTPPRVVIEGLLTNTPGYQSVKVSRSTDFYAVGEPPRVTNATVQVLDDRGAVIDFIHNPRNHPDSMGIYLPEENFSGTVGTTYTLHVELDGEVYEGSDQLEAVAPIDSLKARVNDDQKKDPKETGKYYEVLLFAREPQDEQNYYIFKFYRNDSLQRYNETDIYFTQDDLLGEKIDGVPSPVYYGAGDRASVEMYSLTRKGYIYYNDLSIILNNDGGGMFGPIPASPRTNLSNGALGFFQVSAIGKREMLVE